jgi:hypothetical protein
VSTNVYWDEIDENIFEDQHGLKDTHALGAKSLLAIAHKARIYER